MTGRPAPTPALHRAALAAVASCPHRGPSLPVALQPYSRGCKCPELWECSAQKGARPEGASLEDCVRCRLAVAAATATAGPNPAG